jgi:hypothetical protein
MRSSITRMLSRLRRREPGDGDELEHEDGARVWREPGSDELLEPCVLVVVRIVAREAERDRARRIERRGD